MLEDLQKSQQDVQERKKKFQSEMQSKISSREMVGRDLMQDEVDDEDNQDQTEIFIVPIEHASGLPIEQGYEFLKYSGVSYLGPKSLAKRDEISHSNIDASNGSQVVSQDVNSNLAAQNSSSTPHNNSSKADSQEQS